MKDVKNLKCSNCSANLSLDDNLKTLTCPYCGSVKYFDEDPTSPEHTLYKEKLVVESEENNTYIPPRPKANFLLTIILLCMYFWPGLIYLILIGHAKKKWDQKYSNNKK